MAQPIARRGTRDKAGRGRHPRSASAIVAFEMATAKTSSGWSRLWGATAAALFWIGLGGALLDGSVLVPLWAAAPPQSLRGWAEVAMRPQPGTFFTPLAIVLAIAAATAWMSGLRGAGSRRWWLTIALAAAAAVAWASLVELHSFDKTLAAAPALSDQELLEVAGRWLRWSLFRLCALVVGAFSAYRAHLAGVVPTRVAIVGGGPAAVPVGRRRRRREDFVWSDDED